LKSDWVSETRAAFGRPGTRRPVVAAALWAITVATMGGLLTEIGPWYRALKKPWFQPPDWAFGPAWTTIFALSATAAVYAWHGARTPAQRAAIIALFVANGLLNSTWSLLFFKLQRPDWAMIEVGFLWLSILAMIIVLGRCSKLAGWLLVPYLVWVSFASVLNYAVVQLNAPF
jgi:translocator protein